MTAIPVSEIKEWVALAKDFIVNVAALLTIFLGLYGLRQWKREHYGKESFALVKKLIKQSHKMSRACSNLREPIFESERRIFNAEEFKLLTNSERWKISEKEAFAKRFDQFFHSHESYKDAALSARAVLGSHVYGAFLDFGKCLTDNAKAVNSYLDEVLADSFVYSASNQQDLENLQDKYLFTARTKESDALAIRTMESRESGETALMKYLGRKSIRG